MHVVMSSIGESGVCVSLLPFLLLLLSLLTLLMLQNFAVAI